MTAARGTDLGRLFRAEPENGARLRVRATRKADAFLLKQSVVRPIVWRRVRAGPALSAAGRPVGRTAPDTGVKYAPKQY